MVEYSQEENVLLIQISMPHTVSLDVYKTRELKAGPKTVPAPDALAGSSDNPLSSYTQDGSQERSLSMTACSVLPVSRMSSTSSTSRSRASRRSSLVNTSSPGAVPLP